MDYNTTATGYQPLTCAGGGCTFTGGDIDTIPSLQGFGGYGGGVSQSQEGQFQPTAMGSGYPISPAATPGAQAATVVPSAQPIPGDSLQYLNGYLRTRIGYPVRVEFLLGTSNLEDRTGTLLGVGANYILLNEAETDDVLACDFYNIKFVTFFR
ncbi:MAG TPA: hypothetical protein VHO71_00610 [Caproiciproducens sp.]|nr:hypothetical protein [Caproiciproducens sp.]